MSDDSARTRWWPRPGHWPAGRSADDSAYTATDAALATLGAHRDTLASTVKNELDQVEFHGAGINPHVAQLQLASCRALIGAAAGLAAG